MGKCRCGYVCRLPGEQEMLDKWGCAKTIEKREQPFNNISVTMCPSDGGDPPASDDEDGEAFTEAFKQKYAKPTKSKDGDK